MTWTAVADVAAAICLVLGACLTLVAAIGILRFPDVLTRMHAATKPQVLGLMVILTGLGLRLRDGGGLDIGSGILLDDQVQEVRRLGLVGDEIRVAVRDAQVQDLHAAGTLARGDLAGAHGSLAGILRGGDEDTDRSVEDLVHAVEHQVLFGGREDLRGDLVAAAEQGPHIYWLRHVFLQAE